MSVNNVNGGASKPALDNVKLTTVQDNAKSVQSQRAEVTNVVSKADSVSLSASAQKMNRAANDAPVDLAKLDRLKRAIINGEYKVDAEKLAQNIAKFERELFE